MEDISSDVDQTIGGLIDSTNVAAKAELLKHESLEMETVDNLGMNEGTLSNDEVSKAKDALDNTIETTKGEASEIVEEVKEVVPDVVSEVKAEAIEVAEPEPAPIENIIEAVVEAEAPTLPVEEAVSESIVAEVTPTDAPVSEVVDHVTSTVETATEAVVEAAPIASEAEPITDEADLKSGLIETPAESTVDESTLEAATQTTEDPVEEVKPWLEWDLDTFDDERILAECQEIQEDTAPDKLKFVVQSLFPKYENALKERFTTAEAAFYEAGGEEGKFAFPYSAEDKQFESEKKRIKGIRHNRFQSQTAERNKNLTEKEAILNELRTLVDAKDSNHNIKVLQAIQERWRTIGQVPSSNSKSLWANYNALVDRYYDQRRIYLELRDIDRRKNLQLKEDIVKKTINLIDHSDVLESVKILNTYHQEYKKIGPVPHKIQEDLWQRFKAASDEIYSKRNAVMDKVKADWDKNKDAKLKIIEDLAEYMTFDSDRINDWNSKTQSILAIQKKWDASGPVSREDGRKINKQFWASFKTFFKNKHNFFKKLEKQRYENLAYKEELVQKAILLQTSQDWDRTSDALKNLQKEWREIGPVPEKQKNEVYKRFKAACDAFFDSRRASNNEKEQEFVENLAKKEAICTELEALAAAGSSDSAKMFELQTQFNKAGFVPRKSIKSIAARFSAAIAGFIKSASDLSEEQRSELKLRNEISSLRASGESTDRKAQDIRRKIRRLEDDMALWKNNIEFFANSKNADALRKDIDQKIAKAEAQLIKMKQQLKLVRSI